MEPLTDMHFSIFNPLGFDDVFDIGKPEITLLSNFNCNDRSLDEVDFIMHFLFWSLGKIKAITQNQLLSELTILIAQVDAPTQRLQIRLEDFSNRLNLRCVKRKVAALFLAEMTPPTPT